MEKIKEPLLRSGIPLEKSVVQKMEDLGFSDIGEIVYERFDEEEDEEKVFSTDIEGVRELGIGEGSLGLIKLAIECKYKEDHRKWFFFPFPDNDFSQRSKGRELFFDTYLNSIINNWERTRTYEKFQEIGYKENWLGFSQIHKGVDIQTSNGNQYTNDIRRSVLQAGFGSIKAHKGGIHHNTDQVYDILERGDFEEAELSGATLATLTIPIVVTTADLYTVKEEVSLKDVRNSDKIEELLEERKGVAYTNKKNKFYSDFIKKEFKEENLAFYERYESVIENLPPPQSFRENIVQETSVRGFTPGMVHIVQYEHLDEAIQNLKENLDPFIETWDPEYSQINPESQKP